MPATIDHPLVSFSQSLYWRLLAAYPRSHREEYGASMAQLFRDQCRDAWGEARGRGVLKLWLRVLPDLLRTSVLEHLTRFKRRNFMPSILRPFIAPVLAGLAVFAFVFGASVLTAFLYPETFASTARIRVQRDLSEASGMEPSQPATGYDPFFMQTEFEVIQSEAVLGRVIDNLNLNTLWGQKHADGQKLKSAETLALLKRMLDLRPVRNTELIEIRTYSEKPDEAAQIANAVADSYRQYRLDRSQEAALRRIRTLHEQAEEQQRKVNEAHERVSQLRTALNVPTPEPSPEGPGQYIPYWEAKRQLEEIKRFSSLLNTKILSETVEESLPKRLTEIVDRAQPGVRPVRPNRPLIISLGGVLGMLLGVVAGIGTAGFHFLATRHSARKPAVSPVA